MLATQTREIMKNHQFFLLMLLLLGSVDVYPRVNKRKVNKRNLRVDSSVEATDRAAFTDWKLINHIEREYNRLNAKYGRIAGYFRVDKPIDLISEAALDGFAASIWNSYEYGSTVWTTGTPCAAFHSEILSVRNELQSYSKDLTKRINDADAYISYEDDQEQLYIMRDLLHRIDSLLIGFDYCIDCLEYHKTYFILYDSVRRINGWYSPLMTMSTFKNPSEMTVWIREYIREGDNNEYALVHFVKNIEADIVTLQSNVSLLKHDYYAARHYANVVIDSLVDAKNIVESDPQYQDELYQYQTNQFS